MTQSPKPSPERRKKALMRLMAILPIVFFFGPMFFEEQLSRLSENEKVLYAVIKIFVFGALFWWLIWLYGRANRVGHDK